MLQVNFQDNNINSRKTYDVLFVVTLLRNVTLRKIMRESLRAHAAILHSRANWAHHSERPTKYFLDIEKKRSLEKQISAIKNNDGVLASNFQGVMNTIREFYTDLYSEKGRDSFEHVLRGILNS